MSHIILNIHKDKARIQLYDKQGLYEYMGRGSRWGNPFSHLPSVLGQPTKAKYRVASRHEAVEAFRKWVVDQPQIIHNLELLQNKTAFGCYCWPAECHVEVYFELLGWPSPRTKDAYIGQLF